MLPGPVTLATLDTVDHKALSDSSSPGARLGAQHPAVIEATSVCPVVLISVD